MSTETDTELRVRIRYVAGDNPLTCARIDAAAGLALETVAAEYNLKRRALNAEQGLRWDLSDASW